MDWQGMTENQALENKKLKKSLYEVHDDLQKGVALSDSLSKHKDVFPDLLINE